MVGYTSVIAALAALSAQGLAYKIYTSDEASCAPGGLDATTYEGDSGSTGDCHRPSNVYLRTIKVEGWQKDCKLELYHHFECGGALPGEIQNVLDRPDNYDTDEDYVCIGNMQQKANLNPALYDSTDIRYVCP